MKTTVVDVSHEGKGIAKPDGIVTFVEGVLPGETITIGNIQKKKRIQMAEYSEIIEESQERITPFCPHYETCGGCSLQHWDYQAALAWKARRVQSLLDKMRVNTAVLPTIGMDEPYRYRNHAQFQVKGGKLGFFGQKSHALIEIKECKIHPGEIMNLLPVLREKTLKGIEKIHVRLLDQGISIASLGSGKLHFTNEEIAKFHIASYWTKEGDREGTWRKIFGDEETITLSQVTYHLSPQNFFQVNTVMAEKLFEEAISRMAPEEGRTYLDLYCGVGAITLQGAKQNGKWIGIEIQDSSIAMAKENAVNNGIQDVTFLAEKSEARPEAILKKYHPYGVIVDPPRAGLDKRLIDALNASQVQRLVYVSCDPMTFARDVKLLQDGGWDVGDVQPFDMFPWTGHVETIALIQKM